MIALLVGYPVPVPPGTPTWLINVLLLASAGAVFAVLVWQAVRYFRGTHDDPADDPRDGDH